MNCVGIVVIAFSLIRIRTPVRFPRLCDCSARLAVAATILFHTYAGGMSRVFLVFVFSELGGLLLNPWALREVRDGAPRPSVDPSTTALCPGWRAAGEGATNAPRAPAVAIRPNGVMAFAHAASIPRTCPGSAGPACTLGFGKVHYVS